MAEYNKQKYYWIKITDKFLTSDTVDFLMGQKDGANYVVLYQLLCLKTINQNGELYRNIGEIIIPYDEEKIQRDTKWFTIDTVRVALSLYQKLGLILQMDNGMLKIADFENMVGSQTISAFKKQEQLKARRGKIGGKKVEKIPPFLLLAKMHSKKLLVNNVAFFDTCFFTCKFTEVIKFGTANFTVFVNCDRVDKR